MSKKRYVVYLTHYKGDKLPEWYIGSSYEEKVLKGYNGSVRSKEYKEIYDYEQKHNKHLFKTKILSYHETSKEALEEEKRLQKKHLVIKNDKYINKSYAQKEGYFGMDVAGEMNPNYGNKWNEEQKERMRKQREGKAMYIDLDGKIKLFDIDDPYIKKHNLKHMNAGKKYSDETNYKKGSGFRGKKRPEHAEKLSGMNCHTAKRRGIFNSEGILIYDVSGALKKSIKKYNLPPSLAKTTPDNPLNYYKTPVVLSVAKNNGNIKYNGWYVGPLDCNIEENIMEDKNINEAVDSHLTEKEKKRSRKSLRRAARAMSGQIQNYCGDWITNYELVKKGYAQLPIGLFATDYNYDNFDSMEDIQIAVLDDMEEGTPDPRNSIMDKIRKMQAEMDEHLDADNNKVNDDSDEGEMGPTGGPDLADLPDEEDIENMTPEELADLLNSMGDGGDEVELTPEEAQDIQDIHDAIDDRIDDIMNDPEISEEEKQAIQDALDKEKTSGTGSGEADEDGDEDGDNNGQGDGEGAQSDVNMDPSEENSNSGSATEKPKESIQDKIDQAMKETAKDADMKDADERDSMTQEDVEKAIKEMEEEAQREEEERMKKIEAAKETRRKQRETAQAGSGDRKPANPINWKILLKKMVPKPIETEEESITKMHNRTKSSLAVAMDSDNNDGIAIKAGIIKDEKNVQKLLFVLDNSGSMSETIVGVNPDIMKVIEKSKKNGVEDMYIIKFDSDWDVYKIDLDKTGKKHKFRQFKNNKDIVKKAELLNDPKKVERLLEKTSFPIAQLFQDSWGGGTEFPVEMSKIILKIISGKDGSFNGVMFTDTDILGDGNMTVLRKITKTASKRPFSFNIILNNKESFDEVKPKLSGYKYISYIGDKELK